MVLTNSPSRSLDSQERSAGGGAHGRAFRRASEDAATDAASDVIAAFTAGDLPRTRPVEHSTPRRRFDGR